MTPAKRRALIWIVGIVVAVAGGFYLDHALGPIGLETSGVVVGSTFITDGNGNPWKMISVKLNDGSVVEAKAPPDCPVSPGEPAHIIGLRSMYWASRKYLYLGQEGKDET